MIMKYISIYQTCRLYGGAEEGGWYYTARDKIKDLKKSFSSDAEVEKWWARIQRAVANTGDRYDLNLEARVFDDKHGPQDFFRSISLRVINGPSGPFFFYFFF